jgi:ketosteroid isomerase-like protein
MQSRLRIAAGLVALSTVVGGCAKKDADDKNEDRGNAMADAPTAPVDTKAAEAEIRKGDEDFFVAVKARDATAIAALYSNDAVSMPENSPPLVGHDAILKFNQDFLKLPQLAMAGESETIKLSDDGTMAYDTGKYSVSFADAKGHTIKDEGKYLNA